MGKYLIRRLLLLFPVMLGVTLVAFIVLNAAPGDVSVVIGGDEATEEALQDIRRMLGLDKPAWQRYFIFVGNVVQGDLGRSFITRQTVVSEITSRIRLTATLAAASIFVGVSLGLALGIIAAVKQHSIIDNLVMVIATMGITMPAFWVGLLLMLLFGVNLGWLPVAGTEGRWWLVLPVATLMGNNMAVIARMTRATLLEVLRQDYIRTAQAKGLASALVLRRHAMKNALIPVVTLIGLQMGGLLTGAVVVESVFALPGIGRLLVNSILVRDMPVVLGLILIFATAFVAANLIVDILYSFLDPKIRYG